MAPLFRRMTGAGKDVGPARLTDRQVARLVKQVALAAGVHGDITERERGRRIPGSFIACRL
ncbi:MULTISPECIES: hypothetical protein [unclassified Chelatococcus]|uniref:hypothetical protein n=1 Tax=unclassified Chelatococcus TaxID=2638111 RepID=UPI001BD1567F|nr:MULTISPECIES: hypothetical protein [unclassified Chelatococcus]MBS7742779.1 hypothetical protein [Chelatococcus sp. HY11]MBX3542103.1 hypothetical protein [Chelatococcus sp.]CAH1694930.1 hypothetical protein CHELA41_51343 [Hyphomicrobiales bacterium]